MLCIVHACVLEDRAFVGMGATVLDGAVIEEGGMLGARGLLTPGKRIGRNELWTGAPARLVRVMSAEERARWDLTAVHYQEGAQRFRAGFAPDCQPMKSRALLLAAWLSACGALPGPVDTAQLPPGEFAGPDPQVAAVNYAAAAFSDQSSTYGNPAAGCRGGAGSRVYCRRVEQRDRGGRAIDPTIKSNLVQGRDDLRKALGIAPDASSQAVVNGLSAARFALQANDQAAAAAALSNPAFTLTPDKTIEVLGNLPYLQPLNAATLAAEEAVSGVSSGPGQTEGAAGF